MRKITIILLTLPAIAFAAAGFVDDYYDHRRWILPAYEYCLVFGLVLLLGMFIITLICKTKTQEITEVISSYLIRHQILAIIATGVLLGIPLGIMGSVSWEIISFRSIVPLLVLMIALPISLVNRNFREKWLLSPFAIKWLFMISVSAVVASLLFIVLTNCNVIPDSDVSYLARFSHVQTHPYDSIEEIWITSLAFIAEIPIAIILYLFGSLTRYVCRKFFDSRHRKQDVLDDVCVDN